MKAVLTLLILSSLAFAGEITVASVTPSSTWSTYNAINLINGSGLSGGLHDGAFHNKWMSDIGGVPAWLIFDLGASYAIGSVSIWNYGPGCCGNERSTKDLDVSWSSNGVTYTPLGQFTLNQPSIDPFPADSLSLGVTARYIRFDLLTTYGVSQYVGLSEVKFFDTAVPEPGGIWLSAAGIGAIAFVLRRRSSKSRGL